ncbi:MAG: 2OG-Fe(II) oxygenase [Acidobacteriota bacterium]|nr:2OG-Fe(II) oxygenase [Acidobacteriota bacterium]
MNKETIVGIIADRLKHDSDVLRADFNQRSSVNTRYVIVDDLLPDKIGTQIYNAFPDNSQMRLMESFREKKYTSKSLDKMDPIIAAVTFAFQAPDVLRQVEIITGFRGLEADPRLYAGGISAMANGHYLNPHIDNSHDSDRKLYRALNLLYYTTPGWSAEDGAAFELWDPELKQRVEIPSKFNRLLIMETNRTSWHSVSPVKADGRRCCVSNYYFSAASPEGTDYFNVTEFQGRPEQPIRRMVSGADRMLRTFVRKIIKEGVVKEDVYKGGRP